MKTQNIDIPKVAFWQQQKFTITQRNDRVYVGHMVDTANKATNKSAA